MPESNKLDTLRSLENIGDALNRAYNSLHTTTIDYFQWANAEEDAKFILDRDRDVLLVQYADKQKELGPNEASRTAYLNQLLADPIKAHRQAANLASLYRHRMMVAHMDVEAARAQLRVHECVVALGRQDSSERNAE